MTDMLRPYCEHITAHPASLLVRITDFLWTPYTTLGSILRLSPTHHMVMENVLYGQEEERASNSQEDSEVEHDDTKSWETYDLKPTSYFFPERDLMQGRLASDSTKSHLADTFPDKLRLTRAKSASLLSVLSKDTAFLASMNVVDYSIFLIRIPAPKAQNKLPPHVQSRGGDWRIGVRSADGKWVYRMVLLDFFWAKHKMQQQALTGVVTTLNVVSGNGPMSITTTPGEYRERFLGMVEDMVEVEGEGEDENGGS